MIRDPSSHYLPMIRKVYSSFLLAFHNIRSHFFHTLLSVLGIVIGVAALVSILSLIDGMEEYANEQLSKRTSIKAITVNVNTHQTINNVRMRKDTFQVAGYTDFRELAREIKQPASAFSRSAWPATLHVGDDTSKVYGVMVNAIAVTELPRGVTIEAGEMVGHLGDSLVGDKATINTVLLKNLDSTLAAKDVIGRLLTVKDRRLKVVGVIKTEMTTSPWIMIPLQSATAGELYSNPPGVQFEADMVEDVPAIKDSINAWIAKKFPGKEADFSVATNEGWVKEAAKGFLLFRIIMGLIVGISVVVGGIGIMNVLLISITERTAEIGIRKAVGANRRDIVLQFLAESITVSVFGSLAGLVIGVAFTMVAVPLVTAMADIPFRASYTLNTLLVVSVLAILLGVVFGTYPAIRASRLDPVEAIRHE